jgi:hypothetical protein
MRLSFPFQNFIQTLVHVYELRFPCYRILFVIL